MALSGEKLVAAQDVGDEQAPVGTSTSTSYTNVLTGATVAAKAFVAPASGTVMIHYECLMQHSGADYCYYAPRVLTGAVIGAGSSFLALGDDNALIHNGNVARRAGGFKRLPGLTPGNSYNVQMWVKTLSGTGTWSRQALAVVPIL